MKIHLRNFVFGVAKFKRGCVVTTYRLADDPDFCLKVITQNVAEACQILQVLLSIVTSSSQ
jgi:hypothetical protein